MYPVRETKSKAKKLSSPKSKEFASDSEVEQISDIEAMVDVADESEVDEPV